MTIIERGFERLCDICAGVAGVILVLLMFGVTADVLIRAVWGTPLVWILQFSEYSLVYCVFLGCAWLQRLRGHVAVDLLTSHLSPVLARPVARVSALCGAIAFGVLAWYSLKVTMHQLRLGSMTTDLISVPQAYITMILPFGSTLTAIEFLRQAIRGPQSVKGVL